MVNRFHPGSNILVTNYPETGITELRAWSRRTVNGNWTDYRANENYNRLAYNSAFTWQIDGSNGEGSMAYLSQTKTDNWEPLHIYDFVAYDNDIYQRRGKLESDSSSMYYLSDVFLPNGVLRVDKYEGKEREIRLGHYSLPEIKGKN
ncbi:MAG: hypothetical protein NVV59_07225 [Chitinophagaceae bacterium]|nr:hypothetical protein [Chitinophagaceae bacterium]